MDMTQDQNAADLRWQAIERRDASADGQFVYAVRSTGVYCRPSCASRRALRVNVTFYPDGAAAEAAGYRPCRRCHPQAQSPAEAGAALIDAACRIIDAAEEPPRTADLAARIGLSVWHFHRQFKARTGLTPQAYARARRAERLRLDLAPAASITEAIHATGFGSSGRFYAQTEAILGMTPGAWRRGGAGETIRFALGECSLGSILVASSARGICVISLGDAPEPLLAELQNRFLQAELIGGDAGYEALVARVVGLIDAPGQGPAPDLPLDIRGTAFQQRVWQALRQIEPGQTVSYAELAARIGAPDAHRAVAGACAANMLAVAIPCHRVVRSDGGISGYRWGVARKSALLARERIAD